MLVPLRSRKVIEPRLLHLSFLGLCVCGVQTTATSKRFKDSPDHGYTLQVFEHGNLLV